MTTKNKQPQADTLRNQIARFLGTVTDASRGQIAKAIGKADYPSMIVKELNAMRTDGDVECEQEKGEWRYWLAKPLAEILDTAAPATAPASSMPAGIRPGTRQAQVWEILGTNPLLAEDIAAKLKQPKNTISTTLWSMHKNGLASREQGADGLFRYTRPDVEVKPATAVKSDAVTTAQAPKEAPAKPTETAAPNMCAAAPSTPDAQERIAALEAERDELLRGLNEAQSELRVRAHTIANLEGACSLFKEGAKSDAQKIQALTDELAAARQSSVALPAGLHQNTADLVIRFAGAMAEKLFAAQEKHGYSDRWADNGWIEECREQLVQHVEKGDPRDVANYCAFLWHHQQPTWLMTGPVAALDDMRRKYIARAADLEAQLAAERQANAALKEQLDALPDVTHSASGYLVRAPKRRPVIRTKPEAAVATAIAAARNGSGQGEVFALIHIGTARRDAVYREAK